MTADHLDPNLNLDIFDIYRFTGVLNVVWKCERNGTNNRQTNQPDCDIFSHHYGG